ncbi:hypothetical protein LIER_05720 [Lithospermum erythrorhizon]|uniref:Uncharacterized protein n=1 Tax=Lithospermum erythrorhizon TaxID=34254 RepID=A0AAV3P356_LITER
MAPKKKMKQEPKKKRPIEYVATMTPPEKKRRIGSSSGRTPMPRSEYMYPTPMPEKLPPEKLFEELIRELPSLKDFQHIDPEDFFYSKQDMIDDAEILNQLYYGKLKIEILLFFFFG